MNGLLDAADVADPGSLSNRLRSRRFKLFEQLVAPLPRPLSILDVGGTALFWEQRGWAGRKDVAITTVNLEAEPQVWPNIESVAGDATDLRGFEDGCFDVVFSNSVIEHLFTFENQRKMAAEVRRVGRGYWVQTPDFWFPVEPHFHTIGWQWLPLRVRAALIRRRRFGGRGPCPDAERALRAVAEVRLVTAREMRALFPDATLWRERLLGVTKSLVAYSGLPGRPDGQSTARSQDGGRS